MRTGWWLVPTGLALLVAPVSLAVTDGRVQQTLQERLASLSVQLADSTAEEPVSPWTRITITSSQILIDDTPLPFSLQSGNRGRVRIPDSAKRGQLVTSLYQALLHRYEVGAGLAAITSGASGHGQILIAAHQDLPYSVLREVLYTAGQAQYHRFDLVVHNPWRDGLSVVPVQLPRIGPPRDPSLVDEQPPIHLSVAITDRGHEVRASGLLDLEDGHIPCRGGGACAGPGDYDWVQLSARLHAIKLRYPAEVSAIVVPGAEVEVEVIVRTTDALHWGPWMDRQASHATWSQWCSSRSELFPSLVIAGGVE